MIRRAASNIKKSVKKVVGKTAGRLEHSLMKIAASHPYPAGPPEAGLPTMFIETVVGMAGRMKKPLRKRLHRMAGRH